MSVPTPESPSVTESVKNLYEQYPFPAPVYSAGTPALEGWCSYTYLYYKAMNEWRDCAGRHLLDAGCGTGETLWPAFFNNPGAHLTGWDLSEASLALAREKLDRIGATDVRLEARDLNDLPEPDRKYDLIFCTGVLHHLADPLKGLRNLVARLQPDGVMAIMLYASDVRGEVKKVQRALSILGGNEPLPKKVDIARKFFAALPRDHVLRNPSRLGDDLEKYVAYDQHMLDMFFHPREVTFTMEEVFDFLDAADLELIRFFDEPAFDLKRAILDAEVMKRAMFLSRRQKYQLADLLDPRGDYTFLVRHRSAKPRSRPSKSELAGLVPVPSPVAVRVDRTPLAPASRLPAQAMLEVTGFSQERYRLDEDTRRVLARCDGVRTVAQIAEGSEAVAQLLSALEAREVIFFKRS